MSKVWPKGQLRPAFWFNMAPQVIGKSSLLWPPVSPRALLRIPGSLNAAVLSGTQGFTGGQEIARTQTDVQSLLVLSLSSRNLLDIDIAEFGLEAANKGTVNEGTENEGAETEALPLAQSYTFLNSPAIPPPQIPTSLPSPTPRYPTPCHLPLPDTHLPDISHPPE
ncbi:Hypothetical predicted protein [Pelobates cultripes]|uniref:Uncharacterized protein n=1 Tax=Pelobates cultripes TaxID=61616 RepID=A0AAD1WA65_PELCU|nr:Hypothetical predicted protein [Pelobates cultripes]